MDALTLCVILSLSTKNIPLNVLQTVLKYTKDMYLQVLGQ